MTLIHKIKHAFQSLKPDGTDSSLVRPSNWNADHDIQMEMAGGTVLGRAGTSAGPVQELTLGGEFSTSGGILSVTSALPIGIIMDYGGGSAPNGWHLCDGALLLRDDYPDLFSVIGERFGEGDGFSTFGVPDLRGRATFGRDGMGGTSAGRIHGSDLAGASDSGTVSGDHAGSYGGEASHVLTIEELPAHDHEGATEEGGVHYHQVANVETPVGVPSLIAGQVITMANVHSDQQDYILNGSSTAATVGKTSDAPEHTHGIPSQGDGDAHQNLPPMMIVTKIIFTGVFT